MKNIIRELKRKLENAGDECLCKAGTSECALCIQENIEYYENQIWAKERNEEERKRVLQEGEHMSWDEMLSSGREGDVYDEYGEHMGSLRNGEYSHDRNCSFSGHREENVLYARPPGLMTGNSEVILIPR